MILKIVTIVFIITKLTRFSIANDWLQQESSDMSENCPRQKYCRKGTHVVCMYYDPDKALGHRCKRPVRIEVTPNIEHHILANVNYLRGKIAMGKEKAKDDEVLPRAYGLMKLEWDKELAFSAQVLANQCLGDKEDECRATERFPHPGQTIGIIRYKYPNWGYLPSSRSERGLDEMKLIFAIDEFLRTSLLSKRNESKNIFMDYPSLDELVDVNLKHYLNLIYGGVTHIGCGVSAYANKINGDEETMKNIVQIICNFSDAPKRNQPVYNIIPPIPGQGYTEPCGCPRGYKETSTCLCEREAKNLRRGLQLKNALETDLKQETRKNITSEKKDRRTNGQLLRHVISKSRNLIVFRRNPEGYVPEDKTVLNNESTTLIEKTKTQIIGIQRSRGSGSGRGSSGGRGSYSGGRGIYSGGRGIYSGGRGRRPGSRGSSRGNRNRGDSVEDLFGKKRRREGFLPTLKRRFNSLINKLKCCG